MGRKRAIKLSFIESRRFWSRWLVPKYTKDVSDDKRAPTIRVIKLPPDIVDRFYTDPGRARPVKLDKRLLKEYNMYRESLGKDPIGLPSPKEKSEKN